MTNYLEHHGIKGMHWGIRRYQNPDGSLTAAGRKRYGYREKDIKDRENNNKFKEASISRAQKDLVDLSKNGYNSQVWKKAYGNDHAQGDDVFRTYGYESKKDAFEALKNSLNHEIDDARQEIRDNNKIIENIKRTPINKKSYTEMVRDGERAAKATLYAGGLAAMSISSLAYSKGIISGQTAITSAMVGLGSSAGMAASVASAMYARADEKVAGKKYDTRPRASQAEISKIESRLANDAQFIRKMERMRQSRVSEKRIEELWNEELDRRIDRYLESKM
jgi:hypothetical protein